jgi:hypothetical protein
VPLAASAMLFVAMAVASPARPDSKASAAIRHHGSLVGVDGSTVEFRVKQGRGGRVVRRFEFVGIRMPCDEPDHAGYDSGGIPRMTVVRDRFRGRSAGGNGLGNFSLRIEGALTRGAARAHGRIKFRITSTLVLNDPTTCRSGWVHWRTRRRN